MTTLLTNLRGPADPLVVLGVRVRSLTPISPALGNVTVVFAALSHAGRLRVTARLDRSAWDDQDVLTEALGSALTRLATSART
ncbi:MAG: WS/DGAT domain-containing protein [Micropruina sp.]